MKKYLMIIMISILPYSQSFAFWGDGGAGWANAIYLAKILAESVKQYQQLKMLYQQAKNQDQYLKMINQGLENSIGLLKTLPIKDEKVWGQLESYQGVLSKVNEIYGAVPKSADEALQILHDQTVAESLRMVNGVKDYSEQQEENVAKIAIQSRQASPKGAARMNVEVSAQILHTLNQLLRVNGQSLKLQSESLAMNNKDSKDSVRGFNKVNNSLTHELNNFKGEFNLPRF